MTLHAEPPVHAGLASSSPSDPPEPVSPSVMWSKVGLIVLTAGALSLAFAPIGQFYLAWVALAPMLVVVARAKTVRAAFMWGWLGGTVFFLLNFTYLLLVTVPGALLLPPYLALYWGVAAAVIRAGRLIDATDVGGAALTFSRACGVAAIWVAAEWLRGTVFTGLPWLFIGYTQSPLLALCQIADFAGV